MKPKNWGRVAIALWNVLPWALMYTAIVQGGAFLIATIAWIIAHANDSKVEFAPLWSTIASWGWVVAGFVTMALVAMWMQDNHKEFQQTVNHVVKVWEQKQQASLTAGPPTAKSPEVQQELAEALDPWLKMRR